MDELYLTQVKQRKENIVADGEGDEKGRGNEIPGASWLDRCHPRNVKCRH